MKFLGNQNLEKYQIKNLVVDKGTSFPRVKGHGQLFFRTDHDALYLRMNNVWKNIMSYDRPTLTITANSSSKLYGSVVAFAGTEFTVTGLLPGHSVTSVTLTSTGAQASALITGSPYPIIPSNAIGVGLSSYTVVYVNGSLTVRDATPVNIMLIPSFTKFISTIGVGDPEAVYDNGAYVWGADGVYNIGTYIISPGKYRSLQDNNVNNEPTTSPLWWVADTAAPDEQSSLQQSENNDNGSGASASQYSEFKVTFPHPISITRICVYSCYGFGRNEMGGSHTGYVQLYVNGALIRSLGETRYHANINDPVVRDGVTEVKLLCYGWQQGGITPKGGYTCMGELEIWSII